MSIFTQILPIIQIVISVLLIIVILLQQRGQGLGGIFGGESISFHKKRGFEKTIFTSTIILGIMFALTAVAALILK